MITSYSTYLGSAPVYGVTPPSDGTQVPETWNVDECRIVATGIGGTEIPEPSDVKLGVKYRDKISGFVGVAVARHQYMTGCERITLQPAVDKQGKLPEAEHFDAPLLECLEPKKASTPKSTNGGPPLYTDRRSY